MKDYFALLSVPRSATDEDVKKAYHNLAKQLHPDKNKAPDAAQKFQDLQKAYETLKNNSDRDLYRRRIENLERLEKENANKPPPTQTSSSTANRSSSFAGNTQSNYQPKFTFMKDEMPKTGKSSQANSRASYFAEEAKKSKSKKPGSGFSRQRSNYSFRNFDDLDDDIDDFFTSRDFFQEAFNAFAEDVGFGRMFDKIFSSSQPPKETKGKGSKPPASKARKNASNSSRKAFSDEDSEEEANSKRRASFFFRDSGSPTKPRQHRFVLGDDDWDFDDDEYKVPNHPRFGRPSGKFASRSRKNEEGFISFNDDNPNLLLKCHHCHQKVPADTFELHESRCFGFQQPEPPKPRQNKKPSAGGPDFGRVSPPLVTTGGPNDGFARQGAPRKQWSHLNKTTHF